MGRPGFSLIAVWVEPTWVMLAKVGIQELGRLHTEVSDQADTDSKLYTVSDGCAGYVSVEADED